MMRLAVIFCALAMLAGGAAAELVVVTNRSAGVERLSRDEVINIFLGRLQLLPSGIAAQPVDLPATQPERSTFYRLLVSKDLAEINAYRAHLMFSGRIVLPKEAAGAEDMLSLVAGTPGGIGYLERAKINDRVKVVFEFSP
jgi:ABC-type phosphate transport system substrate-binding protein